MDMSTKSCAFAQSVSHLSSRSSTPIDLRRGKHAGAVGCSLATRMTALAGASIISMMVVGVAKADEVSDLKREIRALTERVSKVEKEKTEAKAKAKVAAEQDAKSPRPPESQMVTKAGVPYLGGVLDGRPVRIVETSGTEITLYGILEATFSDVTNTTTDGKSKIGMQTAWFSGNRWGLYGQTMLDPDSKLKLIARLESEFELPTGNMDTGNVLFNRDAWLGLESSALGKLTVGRQNTLPRDFSNIWGDPYGSASLSTNEGGYTNVNNFKQLIFYSGGGSGAGGQGDTRLDNGIVWKKVFDNGLVLGAAYAFSDGNGPGGPNGSGAIPGAGIDKGSVQSVAVGYNGDHFHVSAFYNHTDVLEIPTIGLTNKGLSHQSEGIGGNYEFGLVRWNLGYLHYTADQGFLGTRTDNAVTTSIKITPPGLVDYELGWQDMFANNAAYTPGGATFVPYHDASGATTAGSGSRMTTYGSIIYHPVPTVDVYVAGDYLKTSAGYVASQANGHNSAIEGATGVRWKF
jgi:predicted porin